MEENKKVELNDTLMLFIDYEIRSSWWASFIWWKWGQDLAGSYFASKVRRKYNRYLTSKMWHEQLK